MLYYAQYLIDRFIRDCNNVSLRVVFLLLILTIGTTTFTNVQAKMKNRLIYSQFSNDSFDGNSQTRESWLFVTVPVGHGDAHVIVNPDNRVALIDSGLPQTTDLLTSFIKNIGVKRLETIVITHSDGDHIGGLQKLIQEFEVNEIWTPYGIQSSEFFQETKKVINAQKIPIKKKRRHDTGFLLSDLKVEVLNPGDTPSNGPNLRSLAMQFSIRGVKFLMMADVIPPVELKLIRNGLLEQIDILKVGHHGDSAGTTERFLEETKPNIALLTGPEPHPDPKIEPDTPLIQRLRKNKVKPYITGRHGYIMIKITSYDEYSVLTHKLADPVDASLLPEHD